MFVLLSVGPAVRRVVAIGGALALSSLSLAAQVAPRPRPAPAPSPAPVAAPAPAAAPLARLEALGPWMADAMRDAFEGAFDARAVAELARAQASMAMDHEAVRASARAMAADMARLSTSEVAAMAAEGARLGIEGASLALSMAPLAMWDGGMEWSPSTGRTGGFRTVAPDAWDAQDPADSLYRDARKALAGESYQRAAELFKQIRQRYPKSSYASDAPYWEAFALQRLGGETNLRLAKEVLWVQQRDYPRAATRGDAAALHARIEGMLGRRGDLQSAQALRGRAERAASDGCPRAEEDERVDALNAVSQMDAERAMPILRKVLARREPCTQQLRRTAVWLVARQKSPDAAALLVNTAKNDPDREVREQAVFWLANVPSEEAVTMLVDLARNGDDLDLRKRAVYALSRSKSDRALTTLREITTDTRAPEELRAEALNWYLGRTQRDVADPLSFLRDIYGKADGQQLKQTTLRYVAGLRTDESRAWLVSLAVNERESIDLRRSAVAYIASGAGNATFTSAFTRKGATPTPAMAPAAPSSLSSADRPAGSAIAASLWQVYEKTGEIEIRRQALASLASLRDNAGIDRLIDVARNEKQPELRRSAISYLSRSKDPRALELLQEIINK
jgi:HEAT repeat protein/TolA-binding protein